jgi:glycerol-3-phosphate acyltransferase PlsY
MILEAIMAAILGLLLGSIPFGLLLTRAAGLGDIRQIGSGNIGATNVLRTGNKALAAATLLLDGLKGLVAVWAAGALLGPGPDVVAGVAAVVGHCFPPWLGFRGGKGVATAAGVVLATNPWLGLAAGLSWLIIAYFFRYSSLASVVASVFAPVYYLFGDGLAWRADNGVALALALMSALLVWRHGPNIARLVAGTESRIGGGSSGGVKGP